MSCESEKLFQLAGLLDIRSGLNNPGLLRNYPGCKSHNTGCNHETALFTPRYDLSGAGVSKVGYDKSLGNGRNYFSQPVRPYATPLSALKYLAPAAKASLPKYDTQKTERNLESSVSEDEFAALLESRILAARQESIRAEDKEWMQ
ncbi:hypothetical protein HY501_01270 [Candidatus Woesearchaeota archaeon]|nr:hypothetical protein [Candidatus Woesearchaeota archaeon]